MNPKFYYGSITEALDFFQKQGYLLDFNLKENSNLSNGSEFNANEFKIAGVFRYEGDSNPDDGSMVLAIDSHSGLKGTLVMGYGVQQNEFITNILSKLKYE